MSQPYPIPPDNMQIKRISQPFTFAVQVSLIHGGFRLYTRVTDFDVMEGVVRIVTLDPDEVENQVHFHATGTCQEAHTMTAKEGEELASVYDFLHTNLYWHTNRFGMEDDS